MQNSFPIRMESSTRYGATRVLTFGASATFALRPTDRVSERERTPPPPPLPPQRQSSTCECVVQRVGEGGGRQGTNHPKYVWVNEWPNARDEVLLRGEGGKRQERERERERKEGGNRTSHISPLVVFRFYRHFAYTVNFSWDKHGRCNRNRVYKPFSGALYVTVYYVSTHLLSFVK